MTGVIDKYGSFGLKERYTDKSFKGIRFSMTGDIRNGTNGKEKGILYFDVTETSASCCNGISPVDSYCVGSGDVLEVDVIAPSDFINVNNQKSLVAIINPSTSTSNEWSSSSCRWFYLASSYATNLSSKSQFYSVRIPFLSDEVGLYVSFAISAALHYSNTSNPKTFRFYIARWEVKNYSS